MIEWKTVKRNRYGHRYIEEPAEREAFRKKCPHLSRFGCEKHLGCMETHNPKRIADTFVAGCAPSVEGCDRLYRWDKKHGRPMPSTIVDKDGEFLRRNYIVRK